MKIHPKAVEAGIEAIIYDGRGYREARKDAWRVLEAASPFLTRKAKAEALRNYAAGLEMEAGPDARMLVKDVADDARAVADEIEEEA